MKKVLAVTLLGLGLTGFSQVYIGKKSKITFFSEAKMENIDPPLIQTNLLNEFETRVHQFLNHILCQNCHNTSLYCIYLIYSHIQA